jgi:hypothetical protein
MRVGLICEGPIDVALVRALVKRIGESQAKIRWPVQPRNIFEEVRFRQGGFGQIAKAVKHLIPLLDTEHYRKFTLMVVVLDQKRTASAIREVKKLIRGNERFVLGIAIREIEAWWLGDREQTLEWLDLDDESRPEYRFWLRKYNSERDDEPKRTLDELTELSPTCDRRYGKGNTDLAREFANTWQHNARVGQMAGHCRKGFAPFLRATTNALRRVGRRR